MSSNKSLEETAAHILREGAARTADRGATATVIQGSSTETFTGRFLTVVGGGFLAAPPTISVTIAMRSDQPTWGIIVALVLGCWTVGGILLAAGLSWPKWKPKHEILAAKIGAVANSLVAWIVLLTAISIGPPLLLAFLSPAARQMPPPAPIVIHDPATTEQIEAAATLRIVAAQQAEAKAKAETEALRRQVATLNQQLSAAQKPGAVGGSAPPAPQVNLSAEDVVTKIDVWQSIDQQMNDLANLLNFGYALLDTWLADVKSNKNLVINKSQTLGVSIGGFRARLNRLHNSYFNYQDIAGALKETVISAGKPPVPGSIFDNLLHSIDSFTDELSSFGDPLPQNFETVMRSYAGAVRKDLNAVRDWQSETRQTAVNQIRELSKVGGK